jgi:hypothetical protein
MALVHGVLSAVCHHGAPGPAGGSGPGETRPSIGQIGCTGYARSNAVLRSFNRSGASPDPQAGTAGVQVQGVLSALHGVEPPAVLTGAPGSASRAPGQGRSPLLSGWYDAQGSRVSHRRPPHPARQSRAAPVARGLLPARQGALPPAARGSLQPSAAPRGKPRSGRRPGPATTVPAVLARGDRATRKQRRVSLHPPAALLGALACGAPACGALAPAGADPVRQAARRVVTPPGARLRKRTAGARNGRASPSPQPSRQPARHARHGRAGRASGRTASARGCRPGRWQPHSRRNRAGLSAHAAPAVTPLARLAGRHARCMHRLNHAGGAKRPPETPRPPAGGGARAAASVRSHARYGHHGRAARPGAKSARGRAAPVAP